METFFISTALIALAEMGDKTQLLAFILATRFKKPIPIIVGILFATLVNHTLAGLLGAWITHHIDVLILRWIIGLSFIVMAVWSLIPDKEDQPNQLFSKHLGVFTTTFIAFFLAEMGDKTQIATMTLSAHFMSPIIVIVGTTTGMLIADVPAVFIGKKLATKVPMKWIHRVVASLFGLLGVLVLLQMDKLVFN